jgi:DNA-binding NarL/FixJ family response regulator
VAIIDVRMPPTHTDDGLRAALKVREAYPDVGVLMLSQYADSDLAVSLLSDGRGGVGYLLKDSVSDVAELVNAVRRVGEGGSVFDPAVVHDCSGAGGLPVPWTISATGSGPSCCSWQKGARTPQSRQRCF